MLNDEESVKIEKSVEEKIIQEVQGTDLETGGVLMGDKQSSGFPAVLVASGPGPEPERGREYFSPDLDFANSFIRHFEAHGLVYLGEWHKHSPRAPSSGDRSLVNQRMNNQDMKTFLLLIVNVSPYPDGYRRSSPQVELRPFLFQRELSQKKLDWYRGQSKKRYPKHRYQPGEEVRKIKLANQDLEGIVVSHGDFIEKLGLGLGLYKDGNLLRWKGSFNGYGLTLFYPPDYPEGAIRILVTNGEEKRGVECPDPERAIFRWIRVCERLDQEGLESLPEWSQLQSDVGTNC